MAGLTMIVESETDFISHISHIEIQFRAFRGRRRESECQFVFTLTEILWLHVVTTCSKISDSLTPQKNLGNVVSSNPRLRVADVNVTMDYH